MHGSVRIVFHGYDTQCRVKFMLSVAVFMVILMITTANTVVQDVVVPSYVLKCTFDYLIMHEFAGGLNGT